MKMLGEGGEKGSRKGMEHTAITSTPASTELLCFFGDLALEMLKFLAGLEPISD